jgi:hypothetical protein
LPCGVKEKKPIDGQSIHFLKLSLLSTFLAKLPEKIEMKVPIFYSFDQYLGEKITWVGSSFLDK